MKYLGVPQSGSQANTTASRGRYGQYYRNRSMPTQPRTEAQMSVRNSFGAYSAGWGLLTQEQRSAWNAYAATHPKTNSLGASIFLSGLQQYIGINQALAISGLPPVVIPPEDVEVSAPSMTFISSLYNSIIIQLGQSDPVARTVVKVSPPRTQGVSFNGDFRFIGAFINDDQANPYVWDLTAAIQAKWGTLAVGMKLFFEWYHIAGLGQTDVPLRTSIVLAEPSDEAPTLSEVGADIESTEPSGAQGYNWQRLVAGQWTYFDFTVAALLVGPSAGTYRVLPWSTAAFGTGSATTEPSAPITVT